MFIKWGVDVHTHKKKTNKNCPMQREVNAIR
jgi:hypothetical protein